jgi:hypothetical protein
LRRALAHGAEEGLAHVLIKPWCEQQQVSVAQQLVYDPRGVGVDRGGEVAGALEERADGAAYHGVRAEDGYGGCGSVGSLQFGRSS